MTRHRNSLTEEQTAAKWCFRAWLRTNSETKKKIDLLKESNIPEEEFVSSKTAAGIYLKDNDDLARLLALKGVKPPADLLAAYQAAILEKKRQADDAANNNDDDPEPDDDCKDDDDYEDSGDKESDTDDDEPLVDRIDEKKKGSSVNVDKPIEKQKKSGKANRKERKSGPGKKKKKKSVANDSGGNQDADKDKDPCLGNPDEFLNLLDHYRAQEVRFLSSNIYIFQ